MTAAAPAASLRICVVGLFPDQQRNVREKCAPIERLYLRFIDENPAHRPDALPDKVDFVIFSRFTNHARWANARAKYPADTVFFCKGGGGMIVQKIFELAHQPLVPALIQETKIERKATMPRGVYDRSKIKCRINGDAYTTPAAPPSSNRVYWTDAELSAIGDEWVLQRISEPLETAITLFKRAQRKALPGDRQRTLASVAACKPLHAAILAAWKNFMAKPSAAAPPPARDPEVQFITLEVPRPLTVTEMLASLDEPSLAGLLAAKQLARENQFHQLLVGLAAGAGAKVPAVAQFIPKLEAFESHRKSAPRIAIVGAGDQSGALLAALAAAQIQAALRFPDGKDKDTVAHCDYAVIVRSPGASPAADRAIGQLGRSRVALVDSPAVPDLMQQIRNFTTRQ